MRDDIFTRWGDEKFSFNESVASVFDDMISRSVPFYKLSNELICLLLAKTLRQNARVLDLGCSLASTLLELHAKRDDLELVGIDSSAAMIELASKKALAHGAKIKLIIGDILTNELGQNDAVILNYTLQFLKPHLRADFLKKIFFSLRKNSVLILSEKLECAKPINTAITQIYEEYKEAQGYSKLEIAKKKEALNSVLIPLSAKDNEKLCFEAGFSTFECIFRWGNFATFVAVKK